MPSSAPIADGEMPLAAASFLKPASHASKPAGSRQVGASREGSHWRQTIKPKKRIIDRMKTIPAEKQEGLFLGTALAQDCGQRSREEPAPDFVQGEHGPIVSMGDFVFEQDTYALPTSAARPWRKREC